MNGMQAQAWGEEPTTCRRSPMAADGGCRQGGSRFEMEREDGTRPTSKRTGKPVADAGNGVRAGQQGPDLSNVSARKNLNETAFFFPHLVSDAEGTREAGIHHARGPDAMEVPRLRPRHEAAQRLSRRQSRHRQGPDDSAQPAALRPRRRRARIHRQGLEPVGDQPNAARSA